MNQDGGKMSLAEYIVKESIIKARIEAEEARRKDIERWINYYDGYQLENPNSSYEYYLGPNLKEPTDQWNDRRKYRKFINIFQHIVDLMAFLYNKPPKREIFLLDKNGKRKTEKIFTDQGLEIEYPVTIPEFDAIKSIWARSDIDRDWKEIQAHSIFCGEVFILVDWDNELQRTNYTIYTPDRITPIALGNNPEKLDAIVITETRSHNLGISWRAVDIIEKIWTVDDWAIYENGKQVAGDANPYGRLPWIHIKHRKDWGNIHGKGIGAELEQYNLQFNYELTHIGDLTRLQTHGQPIFENVSKNSMKGQAFGASYPLFLESNDLNKPAKFYYASPNAKIPEIIDFMVKYVTMIYKRFGCESRNIARVDVNNPESGIAKYLSTMELIEMNVNEINKFLDYEKEFAQLVTIVDNVNRGKSLDKILNILEYTDVSIDYQLPDEPMTQSDKSVRDEYLVQTGVKSPVDIAIEENPDLDRDTAFEQIVRNRIEQMMIERTVQKKLNEMQTQGNNAQEQTIQNPINALKEVVNE